MNMRIRYDFPLVNDNTEFLTVPSKVNHFIKEWII